MRTFSSTVAFGNTLVIWYERAMPFCEMRSGGNPVMSSPFSNMRPDVGCKTPVRQLKNVLLPAPFGPITARISSRATAKLTPLSAVNPPKRIVKSSVRNMVAEASAPALIAGALASNTETLATYAPTLGEGAGRREHRLFLRHDFEDPILAFVNVVDEFTNKGLMILFAQGLIAL